jgi:imidazole glycerol-phosphate synthase subunit HisH
MNVAIVDYRAGNLTSVKQAFLRLGATVTITSQADELALADRIVVPGVGHFSNTASLAATGLQAKILEAVDRGVPLLGICLGMQWFFQSSQEAPAIRGLGLMEGECEHFPSAVKSPHVGWNQLELRSASPLLRDVQDGSYVYFTHSFCAPITAETSAVSQYGRTFSAAVECGNIFGVQFHPEKSGRTGLKILANFCAEIC